MGVLLGVPQILELNNNYKNIELIFVFRSYCRTTQASHKVFSNQLKPSN